MKDFLSIERGIRCALVGCAVVAMCSFKALAQPALWVVKDRDSTIFLFGTIAALKPDTQWMTPRLEQAIASAQELWLELPTTDPDVSSAAITPLVAKYAFDWSSPLSDQLTSQELQVANAATNLGGITSAQLDHFRPWFVALTIANGTLTKGGYVLPSGANAALETAFRQRGIKPNGLETYEQQLQVFGDLTPADELAFLREVLVTNATAVARLDTTVDHWLRGDLQELALSMASDPTASVPALYAAMMMTRNADWATQIERMLLGEGTIFVAATTGHFVGPDSVIALLGAKGIVAERVQ